VRHDQHDCDDLLAFRQFRRNVIEFLRFPLDVSESALRDSLNTISPNLLASYKHRAARATLTWASMCRTDLKSLNLPTATRPLVQAEKAENVVHAAPLSGRQDAEPLDRVTEAVYP
jgi:hypothetical protein